MVPAATVESSPRRTTRAPSAAPAGGPQARRSGRCSRPPCWRAASASRLERLQQRFDVLDVAVGETVALREMGDERRQPSPEQPIEQAARFLRDIILARDRRTIEGAAGGPPPSHE